jgi:hypothetical protein
VVVKTEVKGRIRCPHCGSGRLLEREIDEEALGFIQDEDEVYLGIDEHSFRHQEMVHTEVYLQNPLFGSQSIPPQM